MTEADLFEVEWKVIIKDHERVRQAHGVPKRVPGRKKEHHAQTV
jgi:hypothetical protein